MLIANDIKSELSYAYLHAVAARAGFGCKTGNRHDDNAAIDAVVSVFTRLAPGSFLTDFAIDFQLKATARPLALRPDNTIAYAMPRNQYDRLRNLETGSHKLLAVLELPEAEEEWLDVGAEELVCRRCMRWVSLRGAPDAKAQTSVTVYIPDENRLTVEALTGLARRISRREWIEYAAR